MSQPDRGGIVTDTWYTHSLPVTAFDGGQVRETADAMAAYDMLLERPLPRLVVSIGGAGTIGLGAPQSAGVPDLGSMADFFDWSIAPGEEPKPLPVRIALAAPNDHHPLDLRSPGDRRRALLRSILFCVARLLRRDIAVDVRFELTWSAVDPSLTEAIHRLMQRVRGRYNRRLLDLWTQSVGLTVRTTIGVEGPDPELVVHRLARSIQSDTGVLLTPSSEATPIAAAPSFLSGVLALAAASPQPEPDDDDDDLESAVRRVLSR